MKKRIENETISLDEGFMEILKNYNKNRNMILRKKDDTLRNLAYQIMTVYNERINFVLNTKFGKEWHSKNSVKVPKFWPSWGTKNWKPKRIKFIFEKYGRIYYKKLATKILDTLKWEITNNTYEYLGQYTYVVIITNDIKNSTKLKGIEGNGPIFPMIINKPNGNDLIDDICNCRGVVKKEKIDEFINISFDILFQRVLTLK